MPAARSESKLTPDQIKQATDELISERDRTEQGTPATTGSTTQRKPAAAQRKPAAAQSAARPAASSDVSASAKQ